MPQGLRYLTERRKKGGALDTNDQKTPVKGEVKTSATQEFLNELGIINSGVVDPALAQPLFDYFPVTSPGGKGKRFLRDARNLDDPTNREAFERARTKNRNAPFFNQTRSKARESYLSIIDEEANDQFSRLIKESQKPENFSRNLLLDESSSFFNPDRAQELTDLTAPGKLKEADPVFEGRVEDLEETRGQFFAGDRGTIRRAKGGSIHIKPENRGKFTKKANAAGMGVQAFASKVLAAKEGRFSPSTRKQANFARNFGGKKTAQNGLDLLGGAGQDLVDEAGNLIMSGSSNLSFDGFGEAASNIADTNFPVTLDPNSPGGDIGLGGQEVAGGFGSNVSGFLGKNADIIQSLGSTAANLFTASKQPTTQAPVLAKSRRTPFKSILPGVEAANAANLSAMFENIEGTGGGTTAKTAAFASTLGANTKAALGDIQARNQFNLAGDRLDAGVSVANTQSQNRINALNIGRRRERLVDMSQAITAGTQDLLNIGSNRQLQNVQGKALVLEALKSGDTGVIERVAESLGLSVEELMKILGDPNRTLN